MRSSNASSEGGPGSGPGSGPVSFSDPDKLRTVLGRPLVCPQTLTLDQAKIDQFAAAIGDYQWIHVDAERAAAESQFGVTIAHGFLTLSLLTWFIERTLVIEGGRMGLNYGLDKVRFVRPAPVGTELTGRFTLTEVESHAWGAQMHWDVLLSDLADRAAGWQKPIVAARWLTRRYR